MVDLSYLHKQISIAQINVAKSEKLLNDSSDKWELVHNKASKSQSEKLNKYVAELWNIYVQEKDIHKNNIRILVTLENKLKDIHTELNRNM